jgi:hypothetical protein
MIKINGKNMKKKYYCQNVDNATILMAAQNGNAKT